MKDELVRKGLSVEDVIKLIADNKIGAHVYCTFALPRLVVVERISVIPFL